MKKNIKAIILSLISSVGIFINYSNFYEFNITNYSSFYNINVIVSLFVCITLYFLYMKKESISKSKKILSFIFAVFMILGESYVFSSTYKTIYANLYISMISIFKVIGYTNIFNIMFYYLDIFLKKLKNNDLKVKNKYLKKYLSCLDKYPFRTSFITIIIFWAIYLIAFYPIVLSPDPSFQIKQYFNEPTKYIEWVVQRDPNVFMTSHHPVLQTLLLGSSITMGRLLGSDNFGLFIYTFTQTLVYISVLSYTIKFAKNNGVKNKLLLIMMLIYIFVPYFPFYTLSAVKDTLYSAFMILFVLFAFDIVKNYRDKKISVWYMLYLAAVMLLISLFRHNGIYIIIPSIIAIVLYSKTNLLKIGIALVIFLSLNYSFNNILVPALGISGGSIREMLSVPFQQTARYVKEYKKDVSKKDKKIIDKVLVYKNLAKRYNPDLADPVKNKYNKDATTNDLINYFKVWFKHLCKHPDVYVDAPMNNVYGYFYPVHHSWYIYYKYDTRVTENNLVNYHYNKLGNLRNILSFYGNIFPYIPVIGILASIGGCTWIVLIMTVYIITLKKKKYLIVLMPLYLSILICVISPANTYFRYAMPYIFALPVLTMLLFSNIKGD